MIFPIGLEDGAVHRIPWVNIAIAVASIGVLVYTNTRAGPAEAELDRKINEVVEYWQERPYLDLPDAFANRYLPKTMIALAAEAKRAAETARQVPRAAQVQVEQERLAELSRQVMRLQRASVMDAWALVPAKGLAQRGLLAHIFMHAGWIHLLSNLFFLYLVGPFLEDIWGRPFFLGFYLLGGALAGLAQAGLDLSSPVPVVGASGAIAACMGAFAFRFATRKIRFFYWLFFILVGTFSMPAWLWAGLWFAREVLAFKLVGADAGVAFMAHIGGFVFGLMFALMLKLARFEADFLSAGLEEKQGVWRQHPGVARALEQMARGDVRAARSSFEQVLRAQPGNVDAALGVAEIRLQAGDAAGASRVVGGAMQVLLAANDLSALAHVAQQMEERLEPGQWRPAVAWRAAQVWQSSYPKLARRCLESAATGDSLLAGKALVQAAELTLAKLRRPAEAVELAERARALTLPADLAARAAAVIEGGRQEGTQGREGATLGTGEGATLGRGHGHNAVAFPALELATEPASTPVASQVGAGFSRAGDVELDLELGARGKDPTSISLELDLEQVGLARAPDPPALAPDPPLALPVVQPARAPTPAAPAPAASAPAAPTPGSAKPVARDVIATKPSVDISRFAGRFADGYVMQLSQGSRVNLSYALIEGVAVGVVAQAPGRTAKVLVVDLVLPPRQGTLRVLRLFSDALGLDTLFPSGTTPPEALKALLAGLLERSQARPPTDAAKVLLGQYDRYATLAEFERALYG